MSERAAISEQAALRETQRRLWQLITWPEGVAAALAQETAGVPIDALVRGDERLDAAARLDVYANAYFYRLLDVLRDPYPTLARLLGEDHFHDLVTSYLAIHPPQRPSVRWIGASLPRFLRDDETCKKLRRSYPWAPDLAQLEWQMSVAFDAADGPLASREELDNFDPERWQDLPLALAPATTLIELDWPVHVLQSSSEPQLPDAGLEQSAVALCVFRRDEQAHWRELDALEHRMLAKVGRETTFGILCETTATVLGDEQAPAQAATWLARWVDDELLLSFSGA